MMARSITHSDLGRILRPGMQVAVPGGPAEPTGLIELLRRAPESAAGVTFHQFPLPSLNRFDYSSLHADARMCVPFMAPHLKDAAQARKLDFIPMHMRAVFDYFAHGRKFDLLLLQVAPPDASGVCRHGFGIEYMDAMVSNSKSILAELNSRLVPPAGGPAIALELIDHVAETGHSLIEMPTPNIDDTSLAIGRRVASLIPDGTCIQTGIGAIPAAVLACLREKNDLGMHSGLIDDAGMALIRAGNITGVRKTIDRATHVTGMAIGTSALYEWLAEAPQVAFRGADYTHDASVIARIENFVSVNSAIEVDLSGQINAESVAGRQLSGTGGSVDFMRGAMLAPGGRSIVALASTARGGSLSRIVQRFAEGTPVTALRTDVDTVVTEHGIAELKGQSLDSRRSRLVEIADPKFRDALGSGRAAPLHSAQ